MQGFWVARFWTKPPPLVVLSAQALPEDIKSGSEVLRVRFLTWRNRLCLTDTDRFIVKTDTREIMSRERIEGIGIEVTAAPEYVMASVKIPQNLPRDRYVFRGFIFSNCGANDVHAFQQPDVHFTVTD